MGKYHINSFVALMNNWKHVIAYQEQYKQGLMVGSSDKENKRFVDSAEGKMIQLSEGLKKIVTTTISTDMFKGVLDVAISFVNVLDKIVSGFEKIGMSIPLAVGSIGGLFATIKGLGTTGAIPNYFANTMNKLIPVDTKDTEKAIKSYVNSQAKLNNYQKQGLLPIVNYNKELGKMSNNYNKLSTNTERVISSNNKMNQSSVKGVKASKETANAMKENARSLYMINSASKDVNKLNNDTKRNLPIVNYNKETGKMVNDYNKLYISGQKVASVNDKVNESSMKGIKASKETANSMKQSAEAMKQNADARKESIRSLYAVNSASKKTGESANSASKGVNELNNGLKRSMVGSLLANTGVTLLNGAFLGLATAGISTAVKMIDEYVHRNEIAKEQAEERIQVAQDEINGYKSQKDGLKSIQKEYDALYNKSNKTPEELERYKALTKEIAELMPELVVGTDSDGNAILNMRGDVSDLISDLDEAIARKEALMAGDKEEAGKIALDELNKKETGKIRKQGVNGFFDQVVNYKDAKEKLAGIQNETNSKIVETESKMNKALLMAQTEDDGQREKALAEYQKYYEERQKIVDSGESEYQSKLNEIQKISNEAGVGIFAGIKSDISFSDFTSKIQSEILSLQGSLDFSDFTREEFPKVQNAIMALGSSGIDLSNFKKSLDETNKAFQSGQISVGDYNKKIDELAKLASDGTGYDVDFWKDMLDGITQGSYEASRGVESFLKSFNKTDNDLRNGDFMAKTLKRQFEAVNNTLEDMMSPNLTKDMVKKYSQNKDLPKEISKMLSNFSIDGITGDEQAFAIKIMSTFQQGDTKEARKALEKINEELQSKGLKPINIDALFNDKEAVEEIGAFEARLNEFKDKDIAIKIKDNTNIKSVKELDILDEQLNKFKDKDTKLNFIADCGQAFEGVNSLDEAIKNIPLKNLVKYDIDVSNDKKLQQMKNDYESLPKDAKYIIDTEVIGQEHIGKVKDMIEKLPTNREMTLKFMEENKDVIEDAKDYQGIIDELTKNPDIALKYGIKIEGIEEFEKVKGLFDSITDKALQKKFANFSIQYPDNIDVIKSLFDNAPSGKKEATLSFMIENADKLQMVQELFDKAPDEQKEAVINFIVNNLDKLKEAGSLQELINSLPPEIKKQLGIEVEGGENAEKTVNTVQNADGTKADLLVNAEVNGESQVVECIETLDKNGNKTYTPNLNPQVNNSEKVVQCMRILDEYGNESYIPIVSPQVTNEEGLNSTKQKMDELDNKTVTSTVQIKTEGETEVEQATNFIENTNPTKVIELSINNSGKDEIDNTKQKLDELNNEKATPTIEATGAEQASEQLNQLSQKAQEIGQGNYHINVSTSTEQGAKNISGLIARVKQFLALKVSTLVFRTETAQAAKNVSGLLAKVQSYVSRYGGKTIKTTFSALTSTAAKNISGLIRKIESFKSNYAGKTFTTTFVTNKVTNSSGGGGGGNSSDKTNKTERTSVTNGTPIPANLSAQPRTSEPAPISDETPVTKPSLFSRAVSRATSAFKVIKPKVTINNDTIDSSVKYSIELFKELENAISAVTNEIALLDKKMEHATGDEKIKYLQEQNKLFAQQKDLIKQQQDGYKAESNRLKNRLKEKKMGFKFDDTGNLTNYEEKLISIEKELDKLNSKSGDKENKKDESRKKELEETKKVLEEYIKVTFTELPKCEQEWEEYNNKIKEHNEELRKAQEEMWKLNKNSTWTSMYKDVEQVNNEIAMIDVLLKNATGDEQIELLEKKKELMARKAKELSETTAYLQETQKELQQKLQGYGFTFRDNGDITNFIQHKNQLKKNMTDEEFKRMEDAAEGYLDLLINKIPDANKEIAESKKEIEALNKEIQDAYKDQLKEAQSLQEKIRDMYKKELEERLKEIDKETKAKIDSLKKQQDAYNDSRKEAKYKDDYEEQQDVISDLEKQIAIAERDSSLSGQKKLKDLQKQLKEEQKKLQDLVQDHVDDQVNDMYDKESDRLQEEADKLKEELEKKYSDENLVDLINEAISSGKFVGLDGEVKKLQDAIIEYINKYEDGMLAMGSVTKQEWLDRLKEGKETLEDINDILDELDLSKFAMPNYTPPSNSRSRSASPISEVNFNSPFFVVQGNVTKDSMKDLEKFGRDLENRVYRKIVENIKS
ncbi:TPA: ATP-binding protein [Clostridioides difficile]